MICQGKHVLFPSNRSYRPIPQAVQPKARRATVSFGAPQTQAITQSVMMVLRQSGSRNVWVKARQPDPTQQHRLRGQVMYRATRLCTPWMLRVRLRATIVPGGENGA